ncbi:hypothetical protein [Bacillus thermotolerans]|uniref:Uncharacterized protein n=1 Tax=Bacillus thermotolerans TaxID=1221996 RepID=A0A0F5HKV9_BACTR|nr:hypothetical protein [Bacillus thermotolerans]KKB33941.1 hypothetical protein QY97_02904 [Bacillus thermotolerans]KKB35700.1 hypothetical protein QY95_03358 [Bacillus thermotolerans]KKB37512.1 hypothetical protein QY96_03185 [Bacillus thermotolerans]
MADILSSYDSQLIAAALLGAFHGINPAMGWLFAVFLAVQRNDTKVLFWAIFPIAAGQMLGDGAVIAVQTFARFHFPLHAVHIFISLFILLYGFYRLFRYYRHFKWSGGLKVGYGQLILWSFLASSTHGSGLLFAPFILSAEKVTDLIPLWIVHELGMLASMTVVALIVYRAGMVKFRKYIVNYELIWAILLITVGMILIVMGGDSSGGHMHVH